MKQFASWFTHAIPHGAALRKSIYESKSESEVMMRIAEFFQKKEAAAESSYSAVENNAGLDEVA